jgi:hypothetical protein
MTKKILRFAAGASSVRAVARWRYLVYLVAEEAHLQAVSLADLQRPPRRLVEFCLVLVPRAIRIGRELDALTSQTT